MHLTVALDHTCIYVHDTYTIAHMRRTMETDLLVIIQGAPRENVQRDGYRFQIKPYPAR